MAISLTQEQFLERLRTRRKLLNIAMNEDAKTFPPFRIEIDSNQKVINIDKYVSEWLEQALIRVITLIYAENLD